MYNNLPERIYSVDEFNTHARDLLSQNPDRREFIRFVLTGEVPDEHQAAVKPLLNELGPGYPISIRRDYDLILGITEDMAVDCPVKLYPISDPGDAFTSGIHLNFDLKNAQVSTSVSLALKS